MARTSKTTQVAAGYAVVPALAAANALGHVIDAGSVRLVVANASGGDVDVTVSATAALGGLDVEDLVVTVATATTAWIGPFAKGTFGQPAGAVESGADDQGRVYVGFESVTSVTCGVVAV